MSSIQKLLDLQILEGHYKITQNTIGIIVADSVSGRHSCDNAALVS